MDDSHCLVEEYRDAIVHAYSEAAQQHLHYAVVLIDLTDETSRKTAIALHGADHVRLALAIAREDGRTPIAISVRSPEAFRGFPASNGLDVADQLQSAINGGHIPVFLLGKVSRVVHIEPNPAPETSREITRKRLMNDDRRSLN